jgi:antirestriction protein
MSLTDKELAFCRDVLGIDADLLFFPRFMFNVHRYGERFAVYVQSHYHGRTVSEIRGDFSGVVEDFKKEFKGEYGSCEELVKDKLSQQGFEGYLKASHLDWGCLNFERIVDDWCTVGGLYSRITLNGRIYLFEQI